MRNFFGKKGNKKTYFWLKDRKQKKRSELNDRLKKQVNQNIDADNDATINVV